MSVSYKRATRCRTCNVLYLSRSEAQICEVVHRKNNSSKSIKREFFEIHSGDELEDGTTTFLPVSPTLVSEKGEKRSKRGGYRPKSVWTYDASQKLIELVKDNYETILTGKTYEKKIVWDNITQKMQDLVPGLNDEQVRTKWKNIRFNFIKYVEREDKGRLYPPEHMKLLLSFLKDTSFLNIPSNTVIVDDDEVITVETKKHHINSNNVEKLDNVYSILCQEISEPTIDIDESDTEFAPPAKKLHRNHMSENEYVEQLKSLNERDKEFKRFIKKVVKNFEERENARELREIEREKREKAREEREIAREEREVAREKREIERMEQLLSMNNKHS